MKIGLYIHIPFCFSKCHYCDFLSFPKPALHTAYTEALILEIKNYAKVLSPFYTVKSIFMGGGTPTMLPPLLLDRICKTVVDSFQLEHEAEWTIEANPGTISRDIVKVIKAYPINRISLGLQSTHNRLLEAIGRRHTFEDWEKSIEILRQETSCAINTDLMFAIPSQTTLEFEQTLQQVGKYQLDHLSVYGLILEEGTRFWELYEQGRLEVVDELTDREMYHYAKGYLKTIGYKQYELSNWAREGKVCKHNILYWQSEAYIGVGLGAHSFLNHTRYHNEIDIHHYVKMNGALNLLKQEQEHITQKMAMEEFMFLGLRMTQGISLKRFKE
ncbi:MAG: oxygen-independent coproporphyrinogen oxidase, partial [Clostridia bacterium]|nr:oxygen-independent coproporphyrinogen oxidase [Clostridia bacterium]